MAAIQAYFPDWPGMVIHESSPARRGASARLANESQHYVPSQYFPDAQPGSRVKGVRCENLEAMTFEDESIDLHITQDVMEHVFHPSEVFREVARTLKPGGAHIFTVPLVRKHHPSVLRARIAPAGEIVRIGVVAARPLMQGLSSAELAWIVAGGLVYTAGVPFYLWKGRPYTHAVWHLFVLAGVACHFVAVLSVMAPRVA